jgi:hypothetical protein
VVNCLKRYSYRGQCKIQSAYRARARRSPSHGGEPRVTDSCPVYSIYEVWDGAGQYRVRAEAPAAGASLTLPVELANTESDDPGAAIRLVVSGGEFDVFLNEQTRRLNTNSSFIR